MKNFIFNMPTRVLFGAGQLGHLHEETLPGKKALIVTSNGQSAKKYGYLARVEKELDLVGVGHVLFDEIRPNPTRENVMDVACAKPIAFFECIAREPCLSKRQGRLI